MSSELLWPTRRSHNVLICYPTPGENIVVASVPLARCVTGSPHRQSAPTIWTGGLTVVTPRTKSRRAIS
jgi:hypothetical protein